MKMYVDELPKDCRECHCLSVFDWCNCLKDCVSSETRNTERPANCPLQPIADHDKQVRREVLEKLKIESPYCHMNCEVYYKVYPEILEKIIGETK